MKKTKLLLFLLLFPISVMAANLETNFNGIVVSKPNINTNNSSCDVSAYYWAQKDDHQEGIRITFYNHDGKQIGNTVDVWNQKIRSTKPGNFDPVYNANAAYSANSVVKINGFTAYKNTYAPYYLLNSNPQASRIDYMKANLQTSGISMVKGQYVYYLDDKASSFSCGTNPLYYSKDGAACLKKYFKTIEVMDRYLNLTGASKEADTSEGNYIMIIEPIIYVFGCENNAKYNGIYTSTELGLLNKYMCEDSLGDNMKAVCPYAKKNNNELKICIDNIEKQGGIKYNGNNYHFEGTGNVLCGIYNFDLRQTVHKLLTLDKSIPSKSGWGFGFNAISSNDKRYKTTDYRLSFIDMSWTDGFGIGGVIGTDLCYPNCGNKKYQIVYRRIDLLNPFLDINGNIRKLSKESNWYGNEDKIDANIYRKKPYLTVTLAPMDIKKIREDNKTIDYSLISEETYKTFKIKFKSIFD